MDKMREEFEKWFNSPQADMKLGQAYNLEKVIEITAFAAWKASRAALVVEMPSHVNDMDSAPMLYDSIVEQLSALGVRYE